MLPNAVLAVMANGWIYFNDKAAGRKSRGFKVNVARLVSKTLYSFLAGATLFTDKFPLATFCCPGRCCRNSQSAAECCSWTMAPVMKLAVSASVASKSLISVSGWATSLICSFRLTSRCADQISCRAWPVFTLCCFAYCPSVFCDLSRCCVCSFF